MQNPSIFETNPKFSSEYMNGRGHIENFGTHLKDNVTDL
jgi:hypothetical protein